ncbi:hypothetical protein WJX73_004407 [Symbiochloris irregularis]|uniref:DNA-(apurinic or apyrimidinic site) endonuclease n=1 Tax=Symbiochloris irregularis TaxID=706552 RepID=A0AAW1NM60_9CHLO
MGTQTFRKEHHVEALELRQDCDLGHVQCSMLESLEAEIVCFQETKITRSEFLLDREACLADGWESFFSCTRGKTGYSGVATFCKVGHAVPAEAQEGLTGLLQPPGSKETPVAAAAHAELIDSGYDAEQLLTLDVEGRCVVTDHGQFVLFNLYAPALSSAERMEERFAYKLDLFKVLFMRMEALRAQGRRVVLVGDFNIAPAAVDSCDPGTGADLGAWTNRKDRALLNSHLHPKGAYCDIFRVYHPDRTEAYTCWNQASGARVNNYGTRIDLILVADACCPDSRTSQRAFWECWTASDIQPERQGSDHAPVWAELDASIVLPSAAAPPALASRFLFNATKQSTLASWLKVKKNGPNKGRLFYVCARPDGPKPHGRCDHFQWVGDRKVRDKQSESVM